MEKLKRTIAAIGFFVMASAPQSAMGQTDTVDVSKTEGVRPTQVPLEQCESVDTCEVARYAIVSKGGKFGIFDLRKHENITEIDLDQLRYFRNIVTEDNDTICYFYAEKGTQSANIGAVNGETVTVWGDNPNYIASLSQCTTIDDEITAKCRAELEDAMRSIGGEYGQVAVLDVQTGQLKAWVALSKHGKNIEDGKILKEACTFAAMRPLFATCFLSMAGVSLEDSVDVDAGVYDVGDGLVIRDHNWRTGGYGKMTYREAIIRKSNVAYYKAAVAYNETDAKGAWKMFCSKTTETNAMDLAAFFCGMFRDSLTVLIPTLERDVVDVRRETTPMPNLKEYTTIIATDINKEGGIQAKYAPKDIDMTGLYGNCGNIQNPNISDKPLHELSFAGFAPAKNPRYAIGTFIDKTEETQSTPSQFSPLVNNLLEWLSQKQ